MIVLDTHVLLWWLSSPEKLSKKASKAISEAIRQQEILISSISVLEVYMLVKKGKLELDTLPDSWLQNVESLPFVRFIPVDNQIAAQSVALPELSHKDPADRIIIATALNTRAKLITADKGILKYPHVQSIW